MIWRRARPEPIWRGVYEHPRDVPAAGGGHATREWLDTLTHDVEAARASGALPDDFVLEHEALLLVLRLFPARPVRVLDFGGGAGASYAYVRRFAPALDVRWTVIELADVVEHGRGMFEGDARIAFDTRVQPPADVVFVKSALQYLDDWSAALRELFGAGAPFVVLEKFSGVACDTYATAQVSLGTSVVPYWFISFQELFALAAQSGYERTLWRRLPRRYDQSGFPEERRMGQASTLIFAKV